MIHRLNETVKLSNTSFNNNTNNNDNDNKSNIINIKNNCNVNILKR